MVSWDTFPPIYKEGVPCSPGCLSHISHPCEKCGRIAGSEMATLRYNMNREALRVVELLREREAMQAVIRAAQRLRPLTLKMMIDGNVPTWVSEPVLDVVDALADYEELSDDISS